MKIAICTPVHSDTKALFTLCLARLVAHTVKAGVDVEMFMSSGAVLPKVRGNLVQGAIDSGAEYMLWIDADHTFQPHALLKLLAHELEVVGLNSPRRGKPPGPTATVLVDGKLQLLRTTVDLAKQGVLQEVHQIGLGFCLVRVDVFKKLDSKAKEEGRASMWPLFSFLPVADGRQFIGEDQFFCDRLREAGVPIYLDHALSWELGHIDSHILTNADA